MARAKTHKDVEYMVSNPLDSSQDQYFKTADEASSAAISRSISDGRKRYIDVLISSASGARWYGGSDAVDIYKDDPDASVHERIVVTAEAIGRVF